MNVVAQINDLLLHEARLLDDWQLDDWLNLYDEDAVYWLPIDERADPRTTPSIIHESKVMLAVRVEQLLRQNRHAQSPRSEMMRMLSNVQVIDEGHGQARAWYNQLLVEVRPGDWRQNGLGEKRLFAGRCDAQFRHLDGKWLITRKVIRLLDRNQPVEGLSFIL